MADIKISALSAIGAIAAEDLIAIIDDPSGTPASRKATFTQVLAFIDANASFLSNLVEDVSPQLGADLDANGFDINIDAGFLLTFDTGTQAQKIVGDAGGLTYTVPDSDTHDFIVDATTVLAVAETGVTLTGTLAVSGILDTLDIETATVSARDGSLAITIADSTGVSTFVSGTILVAPVLGTPASGVLDNCTISGSGITHTINAQTGTTYTFVLSDDGAVVTSNNASAVLMTIPPNSSVAYPVGASLTVISIGAGLTSVDEGSGVLINSTGADPDLPVIRAQHSSATFIKIATDTWQAVGDIA